MLPEQVRVQLLILCWVSLRLSPARFCVTELMQLSIILSGYLILDIFHRPYICWMTVSDEILPLVWMIVI